MMNVMFAAVTTYEFGFQWIFPETNCISKFSFVLIELKIDFPSVFKQHGVILNSSLKSKTK